MIFEYFSLSKISSVPSGETAFRRDPTPSVLTVVNWKQDSETDKETGAAMVERGRTLAHELCDIIGSEGGATPIQKLGYANYGKSTAFVTCHRWFYLVSCLLKYLLM
jgi:hypothetical protein